MPDDTTPDATLAKAAGLASTWASHQADVAQAIAAAQKMRTSFARPADASAEPMPAYALGGPIQAAGPLLTGAKA